MINNLPYPFNVAFDWGHSIDYRGLIENGLALEAPEGMYKKEESK